MIGLIDIEFNLTLFDSIILSSLSFMKRLRTDAKLLSGVEFPLNLFSTIVDLSFNLQLQQV